MNSKPFRTSLQCIPVVSAASCIFQLEVQVLGKGHAPTYSTQNYELVFVRNNENWIMKVAHNKLGSYSIELHAPTSAAGVTCRVYQRAISADIEYRPSVSVELHLERPDGELGRRSLRWRDEVLRSQVGEFREKNQQEVPVNVEGIGPEHFEAFLQCIYPGGNELKGEFIVQLVTLADFYNVKHVLSQCAGIVGLLPNVPKMDLLRTAIKINSEALESAVIATYTKDDLQGLLASDLKDQLDGARWQKLLAKALAI